MIKKLLFTILFSSIAVVAIAEPLTTSDISRLKKIRFAQHVLLEHYLVTDKGLASVFGYQFDTFFEKDTAFVLAIYGAVGGSRGGYGIAAFGLAKEWALAPKLRGDVRVLLGSGGGGGLSAGGGLAWELQGGLLYELNSNLSLEGRYGYLKFPSGSFETPIFTLGLSYSYDGLFLPN